jgi:hypothetical protein
MSIKILALMCGVILAAGLLTVAASASVGDGSLPALHLPIQADSIGPAQVRLVTATPTPVKDEILGPVRSEAGRDIGLVVGASILVLIVIGGVILSFRHRSGSKARD